MIASASRGITAKAFNIHHGNLSSLTSRRIMDINRTESQNFDRQRDPDIMDTSLDLGEPDGRNDKSEDHSSRVELPADPDAEDVLERPREEGDGSAVAEQDGKTSDRPFVIVIVQLGLTWSFMVAQNQTKPYLTQDLLSLFNLQHIVATVARVDHKGEKINKMRKSYEGKVKNFQLAGRNRAVKHEPGKLIGLSELVNWPEEEWQNQKVIGKEVQNGLSSATLAKLEKAMHMLPGPVPNNNEWEDLLGHEKIKPAGAALEQNSKKSAQAEATASRTNGLTNGVRAENSKVASEIPRPKRSGKKRRYDEHSFEGYGEGFVDDEGDVVIGGGYSSGEGSRKSGITKKRRKVST